MIQLEEDAWRTSASKIQQIFDAEPETDYLKALYFSDEDTLYWWYCSDLDGVPTHAMALQSWNMTWDEMMKRDIVPILGGDIYSDYDPPEVVSGKGDETTQRRAQDLLEDLLEGLRAAQRPPFTPGQSKVSSKIVEVETEHGFGGQGGETRRPVVYIPEQDTMYVGGLDGSHASVIAAIDERFRKEYPQGHGYTGDDRGEYYGYWEVYDDEGHSGVQALTDPQPTSEQKQELIDWTLGGHGKVSNIYDPIEKELDHHAFKNGEPRQSVVNFIKRLYGRALKAEYGIENPELFIDLYITGSLTTFQYSETSDCDVSVFPNYERFAQSFDEDASKTRKRLVALSIEHIDGTFLPGTTHPLQFFVVADGIRREDLYAPGLRSAWSIFDEMGVVPPEKSRSHEVAAEFPDAYARASAIADKMKDALDHDPESARELGKQVHQKRQLDQRAGLGDYCEGNIVYKWLLHEGLFDRIKNELHEYIARTAAVIYEMKPGEPILDDETQNTITDEQGIKAYVGGEPAGNITYEIFENDYIYAHGIFVKPEFQKTGVMRQMVDYLYQKYQLPISGEFFNRTLEGYIEKRNIELENVDSEQPGNARTSPKFTVHKTGNLRVVNPSTVNYDATSTRGDLGYPVVADMNTHQAFIGPRGSHHTEVMQALNLDPESWEHFTWINLGPPGTYGWGGRNDGGFVGWYEPDKEDGELSDQLAEWVKQNDPRTKEAPTYMEA